MYKCIIPGLLGLFLLACSSEVDLGEWHSPPKLTLVGLISPDRPISVRLSATVPIIEKTFPVIENARIQLYENEALIGTMDYVSERNYTINYYPRAGQTYTIVAEADGFPVIKAVEILPANIEQIELGPISFQYPTGMLEDYIVGTAEFDLKDDSENTVNYYEMPFSSIYAVYSDAISYDKSRDFMRKESILFTNQTFAGTSMHFSIQTGFNYSPVPDFVNLTVRKVSPAYYAYKTTWYEHQYNQMAFNPDFLENLFLLNSSVNMYSNIENGYGIFASYAETVKVSER